MLLRILRTSARATLASATGYGGLFIDVARGRYWPCRPTPCKKRSPGGDVQPPSRRSETTRSNKPRLDRYEAQPRPPSASSCRRRSRRSWRRRWHARAGASRATAGLRADRRPPGASVSSRRGPQLAISVPAMALAGSHRGRRLTTGSDRRGVVPEVDPGVPHRRPRAPGRGTGRRLTVTLGIGDRCCGTGPANGSARCSGIPEPAGRPPFPGAVGRAAVRRRGQLVLAEVGTAPVGVASGRRDQHRGGGADGELRRPGDDPGALRGAVRVSLGSTGTSVAPRPRGAPGGRRSRTHRSRRQPCSLAPTCRSERRRGRLGPCLRARRRRGRCRRATDHRGPGAGRCDEIAVGAVTLRESGLSIGDQVT